MMPNNENIANAVVREEIRKLGKTISPQVVAECMAIYGRYTGDIGAHRSVNRDIAYGPDIRHRLDIFGDDGKEGSPVLLYVHGGGFIGGDKVLPGTPFYDNIGAWAAEQGFVGVTMTYRLAPDHPWPAGAQDVAAAVAWLRQNIHAYGGSPERIFVAGQSAGATHVASYIAMSELHDVEPPLAGAFLFSGLYDVPSLEKTTLEVQYFGDDARQADRQSSLRGLIETEIPLLLTVAEHDPHSFQAQAALLVQRWFAAKAAFPRLLYLPDANHMSAALGIGGLDRSLAFEMAEFIHRYSGDPA
jgi:acetyl esterase/lipase